MKIILFLFRVMIKEKESVVKNLLKIAFSVGLSLSVWILWGFFTNTSVDTWYFALEKSTLNPPNWIFGPVWTLLYVLMGLAFFGVIKEDRNKHNVKVASVRFLISLVLNLLWSIIFFALKSPVWAMIEILILLWVLVYVAYLFKPIKKLSFYFTIPYILWVAFASFLTFRVVVLN